MFDYNLVMISIILLDIRKESEANKKITLSFLYVTMIAKKNLNKAMKRTNIT